MVLRILGLTERRFEFYLVGKFGLLVSGLGLSMKIVDLGEGGSSRRNAVLWERFGRESSRAIYRGEREM